MRYDMCLKMYSFSIAIMAKTITKNLSKHSIKAWSKAHTDIPTELCETARLNSPYIIPVKSGLGDKKEELQINICDQNSGSNSLVSENFDIQRQAVYTDRYETVQIITLDAFVEANGITKIDYIKSDIEGFERNLLRGAQQTLKRLAPKLAICTYHFPDDPKVLESLILKANPNYTVVHLRHKLFAMVIN